MELSPTLPAALRITSCSIPRLAPRSVAMAALAENHNQSASQSSSSSQPPGIPKMEPFNRGRVSRLIKEPSILDKAEHAISDRCSTLEGDDAYQCWEALFEFEDMKEEYSGQCEVALENERRKACGPLERLESFVRQSGGVASLINNVRVLAKVNERLKSSIDAAVEAVSGASQSESQPTSKLQKDEHFFPEAGNLPPSEEELELEKNSRMPESPFTSVLRAVGLPSTWYGQPSD